MKYTINNDGQVLRLTIMGVIDKAAIITIYQNLLRQPEFTPGSHTLWDIRLASLDIDISENSKVTEMIQEAYQSRSSQARCAFVVNDVTEKTLLETYLLETSQYPVEFAIFESLDDANQWLT